MAELPVAELLVAGLLVVGLLGAGRAHAQSADSSDEWRPAPDSVSRHAVQLWSGYSPGSVKLFGTIEGVRFGAVGVRYLRRFRQHAGGSRTVAYTADVLPLVWMTYAPVRGAPKAAQRRGWRTLRGVGLTPAGLRMRGRLGHRWQPYFEGGLGFVYFSGPLPDRRGERFNLTFRVGVGVRVEAGAHTAFKLGYRFHHLSNGFRGRINPGFDSNLFHLGLTWAWF
ncbi:MAG: hypothetical protein BRD44_04220 [Bacteroidetes bacterium QS_7_67_15]|nr:MAG: hypothetical protein BRD44_04220 [Bacteroidetes bacterium QS_7_67_15]